MRRGAAAFLYLALVTTAEATGWENQYLANTGGSHLVVVPQTAAQITEAYVDNDEGWRLRVLCTRPQLEDHGPIRVAIHLARIGKGDPVWGSSASLAVSFDGGSYEAMSETTYAGGSYNGRIHGGIFAKMQAHGAMKIARENGKEIIEFTLENSINALDAMNCGRY